MAVAVAGGGISGHQLADGGREVRIRSLQAIRQPSAIRSRRHAEEGVIRVCGSCRLEGGKYGRRHGWHSVVALDRGSSGHQNAILGLSASDAHNTARAGD